MSDEQAFSLINALPLVGWAALVFAPLRRGLLIAVARVAAVAVAAGYVVMIALTLSRGGGAPLSELMTLGGLARAFADPRVMLIGWAHYLALDLWTGTWEAEDAGRRGVPHWALLPALALTFLAGPAGLLLYLALRRHREARQHRQAEEEPFHHLLRASPANSSRGEGAAGESNPRDDGTDPMQPGAAARHQTRPRVSRAAEG